MVLTRAHWRPVHLEEAPLSVAWLLLLLVITTTSLRMSPAWLEIDSFLLEPSPRHSCNNISPQSLTLLELLARISSTAECLRQRPPQLFLLARRPALVPTTLPTVILLLRRLRDNTNQVKPQYRPARAPSMERHLRRPLPLMRMLATATGRESATKLSAKAATRRSIATTGSTAVNRQTRADRTKASPVARRAQACSRA